MKNVGWVLAVILALGVLSAGSWAWRRALADLCGEGGYL